MYFRSRYYRFPLPSTCHSPRATLLPKLSVNNVHGARLNHFANPSGLLFSVPCKIQNNGARKPIRTDEDGDISAPSYSIVLDSSELTRSLSLRAALIDYKKTKVFSKVKRNNKSKSLSSTLISNHARYRTPSEPTSLLLCPLFCCC